MGEPNEVELVGLPEAADLLNVSERYLRRPLADGVLTTVEGQGGPRLGLADVLAYKAARDARRRAGLGELVRLTEEFGGYDAERAAAGVAGYAAAGAERDADDE